MAVAVLVLLAWVATVSAAPIGGPAGTQAYRVDEPALEGFGYVYEAGKEHALTIVLVHGIGPGAEDYAETITWLARSYHVVAVDLPGFGRSSKANVAYSPTNYVIFLKRVAERFAHRPFVLVGHSMGAVVSLRYAATYPDDVAKLVVIDAPGILHRYAYATHHLAQIGLEGTTDEVDPASGFAKVIRKILGSLEQSSFDPEVVLASPKLRETMFSGDPSAIAGLAVAIEDFSKQLRKLSTDTLVIWGKDDLVTPVRTGKLLEHVMPHARLVVFDTAAHVPMREAPERFRSTLASFLDDTPVPLSASAPLKKYGNVSCTRRRDVVYEGDYESLNLNGCQQVIIRNARVHQLKAVHSRVTIEQSYIGGGDVGLLVHSAVVVMTGGRIEGDTAITAIGSRLDLAGVDIDGKDAAIKAPQSSSVVFSICRMQSPHTKGEVHGYYALAPDNPM